MEHEMTAALRPVARDVEEAIGELPSGAFNYGLYFQKWFYVVDGAITADRWKRPDRWKCSLSDETDLVKRVGNQYDHCMPNWRLDNLAISLALFNGERSYQREIPISAPRG